MGIRSRSFLALATFAGSPATGRLIALSSRLNRSATMVKKRKISMESALSIIELYNSCLGGHPCDWLFHHSWQAFALPVGFVRYVYFGVVTFVASRLVLLLQAFALLQKVKIFGCGHLCVQPCCLAGLCAVICGSGPEHNSSDLLDESQQSVIETLDWH